MKLEVWSFADSKDSWFNSFLNDYQKKISFFYNFEIIHLRSSNRPREELEIKKRLEADLILKKLDPQWGLCLLDEQGKKIGSKEWASQIEQWTWSGKTKWVFLIGGAFGVAESVKARADLKLCLSPMTLNHLVAEAVLLEQIYRSCSIIHNKPYHNE